jgi:uncharacterized membrane protein YozB (DUF420 family)
MFFLHYFFRLLTKIDLGELFLCEVVKLTVYVALYHYFIKAAANLIGKKQATLWRDRITTFTYIALVAWAIFLVLYLAFALLNELKQFYTKGACKLPTFIAQGLMVLVIVVSFCFAGIKITRTIRGEQQEASTGGTA